MRGGQAATTSIPYDELKKLWTYETVIKELLANCKLFDSDENILFLPFKAFDRVLKNYIPDEVEKRLTELQEEKTEY